MIKLLKKDFNRTFGERKTIFTIFSIFHPRFLPVLFIRLSQYLFRYKMTKPISYFFSFLNIVLFSIEVTPRCIIDEGIYIPHSLGTVIGASKIGKNCTIFQGVTLGATYADKAFTEKSRPILLDNVTIGAGAKVLGGIIIGNNVKIAANSLVINSVPDNVTVIGVPATIYKNNISKEVIDLSF